MKRLFGTVDIVGAPLVPAILRYSIPVMIASVVQVLFNAVDIAVLGNMAGSAAVASVGVTASIVALIVTSFTGLGVGVTVLLARFFGARNVEQIRKTVSTTVLMGLGVGILLSVVGLLLAPAMLRLVNCPAENYDGALLYLTIYLLGAPAVLVYSFASSVLRVSGDTVRPLIYIVASGLLNVVLNIVLCLLLPQKVAAVAIATLASQVLGAVLTVGRLCRLSDEFRFSFRRISFDFGLFKKILRIGLPAALNTSLYCISNILIASSMNGYGEAAIAGNTAAGSIESIVSAFVGAFSAATAVFVGQNLGAEKHDRVKKSIFHCLWIAVAVAVLLGDGAFLLGRQLLGLYIPGQREAIEFGMVRLSFICSIYFITAINSTLANAMQAFGYTTVSASISIVTVLVFRFVWMWFIYPRFETIRCLYFCYSCSWSLNLLAATVAFFMIWRVYRQGKLKRL